MYHYKSRGGSKRHKTQIMYNKRKTQNSRSPTLNGVRIKLRKQDLT